MKSVKVVNGKFEATLEMLQDGRVRVEFIIPEESETFKPDEYSWIIDKMKELIQDKKNTVEFQGVDFSKGAW